MAGWQGTPHELSVGTLGQIERAHRALDTLGIRSAPLAERVVQVAEQTVVGVPCPACGRHLPVQASSRRLQQVGGPHVVEVSLTLEALAHLEGHDPSPDGGAPVAAERVVCDEHDGSHGLRYDCRNGRKVAG